MLNPEKMLDIVQVDCLDLLNANLVLFKALTSRRIPESEEYHFFAEHEIRKRKLQSESIYLSP